MTLVVTERAVQDAGGSVKVRHSGRQLIVTWFCGDTFAVRLADVMTIVGTIERLQDYDVWVKVPNDGGKPARVKLRAGRLHAEGSHSSVDFKELRKAVKQALKSLS